MALSSLVVFGLVSSVCAYTVRNVSSAWRNHAEAFGANDAVKIMLDYDVNSVLEVYDAGSDTLTTYDTSVEIKRFFEGVFMAVWSPNRFALLKNPFVEEPSPPAVPFGQVFLLWESPDSSAKFPVVTDTLVFDPTTFKIIRQNIVVFSDMSCPQRKSTVKHPVETSGPVQRGWNNHFSAFGGQNLTKMMLDYTDDSKVTMFSNVNISAKGRAPIEATLTGLFAELADRADLQVPYVATSTFGLDGDVAMADLGMTFLIWRSPTDNYAHVTETLMYNSAGKIIRQNIVAMKTVAACAASYAPGMFGALKVQLMYKLERISLSSSWAAMVAALMVAIVTIPVTLRLAKSLNEVNPTEIDSDLKAVLHQTCGKYLMYSQENQGTSWTLWSKTPCDGSLAFFHPHKDKVVPDFKFAPAQRKAIILTQTNLGVHKKRHYAAVAQFIKDAKSWDGQLNMLSEQVRITLLLADGQIVEVCGSRNLNADDIHSIYVESKDSHTFAGVKALPALPFATKATQNGGGALVTMHA